MRQKQKTVMRLAALCVVWLAILLNWQGKDSVPTQETISQPQSAVMAPQKQHHREATLTDASQLYRVCNSRPQRVTPTQGAKSNRTTSPYNVFVRQHIVKSLHIFHDSRHRLETAPFCVSASRDYYVIALRHIIR